MEQYFSFENIRDIKNYYVHRYQFLDDLGFIRTPESFFKEHNLSNVDKYINEVKKLFKRCGWEGDGDIGIMWFPPFVGAGVEDTYGVYVWHVKQYNNGISWIATPVVLPFPRLEAQIDKIKDEFKYKRAENIIQCDIDWFLNDIQKQKESFVAQTEFLSRFKNNKSFVEEIHTVLCGFIQNQIVTLFYYFVDYCYLRFLMEGIKNGNKNIKLKKFTVTLEPQRYLSEDADEIYSEGAADWLTIMGIIDDIWHSYKFLSFKDKFNYLVKSVDFDIEEEARDMIFKHSIIRNCIQHHNWKLEKSSLERIGRNSIEIKTSSSSITIKVWKKIQITFEEIMYLCDILEKFARNFGGHVDKKIGRGVYKVIDGRKKRK